MKIICLKTIRDIIYVVKMYMRKEKMKKDNIVTLNGENNKKMDFYIDAELEYDGYKYQILRPVEEFDDLASDEAIVFRIEETNDGEEFFIEENDDIISEIENIYNNM